MQNLIELYEMVSMNDAALCGSEKMAILRARFALGMFAQAMAAFKTASCRRTVCGRSVLSYRGVEGSRLGDAPPHELMNVFVINAGSSSLKFQVIATDLERIRQDNDELLCRGQVERIGGEAIITVQSHTGLAAEADGADPRRLRGARLCAALAGIGSLRDR